MEGNTIIINSNNSCLVCFEKLGKAHRKELIFSIHRLTRKLNVDLGHVFPDVKAHFEDDEEKSSEVLQDLKLRCHLCMKCSNICKKLEKCDLSAPDGEVKIYAKVLFDKISKVELSECADEYMDSAGLKPLDIIHFGIVKRLRNELKEMLQMLQANPLENDVVQCTILSFLGTHWVKRCRLINKQWNSNCYRILKQRAASSQSKHRLRFSVDAEEWRWQSLLSQLESGSQYPLAQNISVDGGFLGDSENEGIMLRFFNAVSPKITNLELYFSYLTVYGYGMIYPPGLTLPHLTSICLELGCNLVRFGQIDFIKGIIQNSPNLKAISIGIHLMGQSVAERLDASPPEVYQHLVDALLEKQGGLNLTSLGLQSTAIYSTHYDQLAEAGLKLKKLHLRPRKNAVVSAKRFLKTQSESLEELELDFELAQFELAGMRMPKLKVLKISGHKCCMFLKEDDICSCRNVWNFNHRISYSKQFPVLRDLQLDQFGNTRVLQTLLHFGRSKDDIGNSVKKLNIGVHFELSPQSIENAAELFPNLTKLQVPAELDILKKVYVKMGKLQDLSLDHCYMPETETCYILMGVLPDKEDKFEGTFNPDASLLKLTALRTLRLTGSRSPEIGEKVCRNVLMKMKSLRCIRYNWYSRFKRILNSTSLLDEMKKMDILLLETEPES